MTARYLREEIILRYLILKLPGGTMKNVVYVFLSLGYLFLYACGSSGSTDPEPTETAAQACEKGITQYTSGNFTQALADFQRAVSLDDSYAYVLGYEGAGWCYIRLKNLTLADQNFVTAFTKSPDMDTTLSLSIGRSSIAIKNNDADTVIQLLAYKIDGTDAWTHHFDTTVTAIDIHLLLVEAYIMKNNIGTEAISAINARDAWGQVKKALQMNVANTDALRLRDYLRGI